MNKLDLDTAARGVTLPPGDLDAVMDRGATLARRKQRVIAGGLTVALLGVTAGIYAQFNHNKPVPLQVGSDTTARRGEVPIQWERLDTTAGLGFTMTMSEDDLYAVSTGPGRARVNDTRRVVWHSADGVEWTSIAEMKSDLYVSNLADRGGRLYGVGTGAATAAVEGRKPVPDLVVGASDDGGRNWSHQALPVDIRAISAKSRQVFVYATDVATTPDATVAIAALNADLDVPMLLPPGQSAPHGWAITDSGVDVLGDGPACPAGTSDTPPNVPAEKRAAVQAQQKDNQPGREYPHECYGTDGSSRTVTPQESRGVTASYTFDQLQVGGDLLKAVQGEPFAFRAAAGSLNFERVDSAPVAALDGPGMLDRDGDGLILVGQKRGGPQTKRGVSAPVVLRSVDGRTWTAAGVPQGLSWAQAVGQLNGRTTIVGGTETGAPVMWTSNGSGGWSSTSLSDAIDPAATERSNVSVVAAGVGKLGVVAVVSLMKDAIAEKGGVTAQRNGYTLHITNDKWAGYITDSSGKELARSDSMLDPRNTDTLHITMDQGVTLVDPKTGAELVTFPMSELRDATGGAMRGMRNYPTYRLIASRDGITWSDKDVNELAGERVATVIRVLMTGEKAVVATMPDSAAKAGSDPKQIALVGTPL
jgi:hypothetical protein